MKRMKVIAVMLTFFIAITSLPVNVLAESITSSADVIHEDAWLPVGLSTSSLPGDVNNDGVVNSADLSIIRNNFGQPVTSANRAADINGDGFINSADLSIARNNFGRTAGATAPSPGVEEFHYTYRSDVVVINNSPPYIVTETSDGFVVTISTPTAAQRGLSIGDMFVLPPTHSNPDGLAGRITFINSAGTNLSITATWPESLEDVFDEFEFIGDFDLASGAIDFTPIPLGEGDWYEWEDGFYGYHRPFGADLITPTASGFRMDVTRVDRSTTRVNLNGNWHGIQVDGDLTLRLPRAVVNVTRTRVTELYVYAYAEVNLNASASFHFDRIIPLFSIPIKPLPGVTIDVPVGLRITASGDFSLVVWCRLEVGFGLRHGDFGAWAELDYSFTMEYDIRATLSLNIRARARVFGIPIYGIEGDFGRGFRLSNSISARCPGTHPDRCFVAETFYVKRIRSLNWGILRSFRLYEDLARHEPTTLRFRHNNQWLRDFCPHGGPTPPQPPAPMERLFLETDLMGMTSSQHWSRHPSSGTFTMDGVTYHRGVSVSSIARNMVSATATYDVAGMGFTRLSGMLGVANIPGIFTIGTRIMLTVTCADSGRSLGGAGVSRGSAAQRVNVFIPPDVRRVTIRLSAEGTSIRAGFGDVYFVNDPSMAPPPFTGRVYLESDIRGTHSDHLLRFPAQGAFDMGGVTYHRGIAVQSVGTGSRSATATYDIEGLGFTRLSGMFGIGPIPGIAGLGSRVTLIVTCADSGEELGFVNIVSGNAPRRINIYIPANVRRVDVRLQAVGTSIRACFGDAYFINDPYFQPQVFEGAAFLESDIFARTHGGHATGAGRWTSHPGSGSFTMNSVSYESGVSISGTFPSGSGVYGVYHIGGHGFTRLSGMLGRLNGTHAVSLIVRCLDNEVYLGEFAIPPGGSAQRVDIFIPPGTNRVRIDLRTHGINVRVGFGNAYFINDPSFRPPAHGRTYLGRDIFPVSQSGGPNLDSPRRRRWNTHPSSGAFVLSGGRVFPRGLTADTGMNARSYYTHGTYNIAGRGFTRLSGVFGFISGSASGATGRLIVTCADSGRSLGNISIGRDNRIEYVDIPIPSNVQRVTLRFEWRAVLGGRANVGFGDAFFARN